MGGELFVIAGNVQGTRWWVEEEGTKICWKAPSSNFRGGRELVFSFREFTECLLTGGINFKLISW